MRKFGMSAAAVVLLALPAAAQYPPPFAGQPYPAPGGYQPGMYAGGYAPDELPPGMMPPMGMMPPGMGMPPGAPPGGRAPDLSGYTYDPCNACTDPCAPRYVRAIVHNEAWVRFDWLNWSLRDQPVPALIATGNPALPGAGVPGGANYRALVGPSRDVGRLNGLRATVGQWFDCDGELGGELSAFVFARRGSADFFTGSATQPLTVPVLGANGVPAAYNFAFPGAFTGALGVRTATQLWSAEGNLLRRQHGDGCFHVDTLFGSRYMQLNERLELFGRTQATGGVATFNGAALPAGVVVDTRDAFRARTEFIGLQIGARGEYRHDMFTLSALGKVGAGANLQTLRVEGNTVATGFGITRTALGGVRGLASNVGRSTNTDFSFVAETGAELGMQVTKFMSVRVGYNLLFWSDVLRPANVIDPVVAFSQVPIDPTFNPAVAATRPQTRFRSSDFLAHGLVVGFVLDW
jgi:hypothetical protein